MGDTSKFGVDPDAWRPGGWSRGERYRPNVGDVVAWRYGSWKVLELRLIADVDLTDEDQAELRIWKVEAREKYRPYRIVLEHLTGPLLVEHVQQLHDGRQTVHLGVRAGLRFAWHILDERHPVCSCHGHVWPCIDKDRDQLAKAEGQRMDRDLAAAQPGVCAGCREPISTRQKTLTFPEPSLTVPGAPGPTFHAGRGECWLDAWRYETEKRLSAYPDAVRIASCPGDAFTHVIGLRAECTEGGACTGHHGPGKARYGNCYTRTHKAGHPEYPRPWTDCGYRQGGSVCLGSERGAYDPIPKWIGGLFGDSGVAS